jgi:hypothetical protein
MAPSATEEPVAAPAAKEYPPAKIFPVKETRFESYYEPQTDGRKTALDRSGNSAIVIDNGKCDSQALLVSAVAWLTLACFSRLPRRPSRMVLRVLAAL